MMYFKLVINRKKTPKVILNRLHMIVGFISRYKTQNALRENIEKLFEGTKVQVGEYHEPRHNKKHLFIRNGFKGKAHYLIEKL